MKQIKKVFADGISLKDPMEEVTTRRDAYCLTLGISLEFLEQHQNAIYSGLLTKASQRQLNHNSRMEEFRAENGPKARLPLENCCGDQTEMCRFVRQIKKDVPRTSSSSFNLSEFEETSSSGKNPIFNILVAYAEVDQELGYTQGMNFLVASIYMAV